MESDHTDHQDPTDPRAPHVVVVEKKVILQNIRNIFLYPVSLSLAALIVINLIPVYGGLFLGWDNTTIIQLYWFENIVVGFYMVLKINKTLSPERHDSDDH